MREVLGIGSRIRAQPSLEPLTCVLRDCSKTTSVTFDRNLSILCL